MVKYSRIYEYDLVSCSELYASTFREPPWNEEWNVEDAFERLSDLLVSPKAIAVKATKYGETCGFIFGIMQRWNGALLFDLDEMCVNNAIQRQGVGKRLVSMLEEILLEKGVSKIYLTTQRDSVPSSFYSSLGFASNHCLVVMAKSIG